MRLFGLDRDRGSCPLPPGPPLSLAHLQAATDARRRSYHSERILSQKLGQEAIKLLCPLHEHMMTTPFVLREYLQSGPGDVLMDPDLRLPRHEADPTPNNEGGQGNARDDVAPILRRQVVEERRRMMPGKPQILGEHPGLFRFRHGTGDRPAEQMLRRLHPRRAGQRIAKVI